MPPAVVILAATLYIDGQCQFMEIYLNNNLFPGFPQTDINFATITIPVGWFILGADNVLAVRSSASGADSTHLTTPSSKYIITYDT